MSRKDAYLFPIYGSAVLFSLYVLFKYIHADYTSLILNMYFAMLGQFCLMSILEGLLGNKASNMKTNVLI